MRSWLVDYLVCPSCPGNIGLSLTPTEQDGDEILGGSLHCPNCGSSFPIRDGVPRFVGLGDDYCGNFGFQWNHWRTIQIDRLNGHRLSETRFFTDSGWDPAWLQGKLILDCGCGAGRFADVAAAAGARVIACDLSDAVNACRANTALWEGRVQPVQASLFDLPLRRGAFDGLFCMGVIQHTPDPERVERTLPAFLRPGGRLAYNFYEADFWPYLQGIKYALRLVTPRLPAGVTYGLSRGLVALLYPVTSLFSRLPVLRTLNTAIPIASVHNPALTREQSYTWTLLDTFDWYSPAYEKRQNHRRVMQVLAETGLTDIAGHAGVVTARRPGA